MTITQAGKVLDSEGGPPTLRLLLIELSYLADRRGVVRHSQTEIAGRCGISRQQVAKYMRAMVETGAMKLERRGRYMFSEVFFDPKQWGGGEEGPGFNEWLSMIASAYADLK